MPGFREFKDCLDFSERKGITAVVERILKRIHGKVHKLHTLVLVGEDVKLNDSKIATESGLFS
ncbi:hypothetical protein BPOR_0083g00010 [Botrytis porri]|uniref:Uncharacterized protein n=1 Tax=Botrytis porri TaxID=87229 RepID=A0A4Z1KZX1_9HELO|nr:hypothetical protein BPOR_0083g00010 [Botrytis porri]